MAPDVVAKDAAAIVKAWGDTGWFSGAVLVAKGDRVLYSGAAGVALADHKIPLTVDMPMRIVSLTQLFTVAAVYKLQEQGKLKLDEPIGTYMPAWPEPYKALTLEALMSGATGVTDVTQIAEFVQTVATPKTTSEIAAIILRQPLKPAPPQPTRANNSAFHLVAAVAESAAAKPFAQYVAETITAPLGLTHTMHDSATRPIPGRAQPMTRTGSTFEPAAWFNMDNAIGMADMVSTVGEYHTFFRALLAGKIVSPASLSEMTRLRVPPRAIGNATAPGAALGLNIATTPVNVWLNSGFINGAYASLTYYPDGEVMVLLLSNVGTANEANAITRDITNSIFGRAVYLPSKHIAAPARPEDLAAIAGNWELSNSFVVGPDGARLPVIVRVKVEGDKVTVAIATSPYAEWKSEGGGRFFSVNADQQITLSPSPSTEATFLNHGVKQTLKRVPASQ